MCLEDLTNKRKQDEAIEILTEVKDNLLEYQQADIKEINKVIDIIKTRISKEINSEQNTFIIKTFSEDDLYYVIPESLESKFDEFEEKIEDLKSKFSNESICLWRSIDIICEEFTEIFDEYSYKNLSNIKIKGVIERE